MGTLRIIKRRLNIVIIPSRGEAENISRKQENDSLRVCLIKHEYIDQCSPCEGTAIALFKGEIAQNAVEEQGGVPDSGAMQRSDRFYSRGYCGKLTHDSM